MVMIKIFLLKFLGVKIHDKMAISAYIFKTVRNDPFLRLQLRAKEDFNCYYFSTNKQIHKG